ncbi:lipid A export permease/ATP-binding protein MsbA [Candidatus Thioglobus sp.]|jgi:subfamily B ATP-binding cassette protein MsbA|uniref:lipid A export permease/ATP-binding protein MsbA n=1 Tax=Candidatus Thioglobus sp. TaxID=2026721 RepID=UPI001D48C2EE|nr:lipid A export permease/ATP-binding protein MsbA [Candidatus Thioglobus sp.]MBT3276422.1 lipid A export permease/ATP-binding protein MsbA [Candidatus Thioglobus sp.]MBT3446468.1 lipid A export permease/ATP-binding protein MsbA [Candidatus Thioglobus sp.]MBT3745311.1 lipid A export permease/ATP-binding protein MsbA [Candidatus Thioglobus sp.]MBT4000991.1 lipid A export permease/ATP-binding protein MsbA [Candidatus Thioglobus sp.]MBT4422577.1 lipid A export permease/ATP-binding protein MsbA [
MQYKQFVSRLFVYLKPHIGKLIFTSVMMMLATALESAIPEITGQIVDELFAGERSESSAFIYALALFGIIVLSSVFALTSTAASSWVSNKVIMDLREAMFAKLLKLPKSYFDKNPTGKTLSKLTFDVEQIAAAASTIWLDFIKSSMTVVILIGYLFYKNWQLSLSLIILLPLVYLAVKLSSNRMRSASTKVQQSMGNMTHLLDENISGSSLVKIYHAQNQESSKFNNLIKNIRQQRFKVDMTGAFNTGFVNILIGLSLGSVVYFSSTSLQMSAGEFLSFFTAMGMLIKPAKSLVNINKPLQTAMAAGESVFGLIDETEEKNQGSKVLSRSKGGIKFNNVSFAYQDNKTVLNSINLDITPGETIALVGSTGSGKTTIIQLIARFYNPTQGSITIDGVDINDFDIDSLRAQISFVDQNVRLFNDTIKGNIALGQADVMSDEKVKHAAKVANAAQFIEQMEYGFDSEIGEDGTKLSGGQRQRLAIARAIAKDSPILILDEATSALDSATEKQVQAAIDEMQKDRTTIIIAHRLSTIQKADRIIVLRQGNIIEQGSHQQLLDQKGEYASLHNHQFKT